MIQQSGLGRKQDCPDALEQECPFGHCGAPIANEPRRELHRSGSISRVETAADPC